MNIELLQVILDDIVRDKNLICDYAAFNALNGCELDLEKDNQLRNIIKPYKVTLKRLKEWGYYFKDLEELAQLCCSPNSIPGLNNEFYITILGMISCVEFNSSSRLVKRGKNIEFSDLSWYLAIDHTSRISCSSSKRSEYGNYYTFVKNNLSTLFTSVILAEYSMLTSQFLHEFRKLYDVKFGRDLDEGNSVLIDCDDMDSMLQNYKILKSKLEELTRINISLKSQLKDTTALDKLQEQCVSKDKDIYVLKDKLNSMEQRNAQLETLLTELCSITEFDDMSPDDVSVGEDVELPETNILFVGGHINFVNKLRQRYPSWTFIKQEDNAFNISSSKFKFMFVYYKHISHKLLLRLMSMTELSTLYISQTNIELAIAEMRYKYKVYLESGCTIKSF